MKQTTLTEAVSFAGAQFEESEGKRTIRNVVLLGPKSKHGYTYRTEAMQRAVANGLYESVRIFINHPTKDEERSGRRDVMKLAGQCSNTRMEQGKVKGDIALLADAQGEKFWNIARNAPDIASCSHVANGKMTTQGRERFVEDITEVRSVDLVVQGATTQSVFEGEKTKGNSIMGDYQQITMDESRIRRKDLVESLAKEGGAKRALKLQVSGAFHSPLMEKTARSLAEYISRFERGRLDASWIANVTGETVASDTEVTDLLSRHGVPAGYARLLSGKRHRGVDRCRRGHQEIGRTKTLRRPRRAVTGEIEPVGGQAR